MPAQAGCNICHMCRPASLAARPAEQRAGGSHVHSVPRGSRRHSGSPPNNSTASGLGTVIFDSTEIAASYTFRIEGVDYGPITGGSAQTPSTSDDVISTHFHNQVRGVNGPVVFGQINPAQDEDDLNIALNTDGSWTVSGRWETTDPASVSTTNFADELGSAPVGSEVPIYFNVHTNQFMGARSGGN
ncbi:CHRD domain-containing protein [Bradyrhizobium sp. RDT10]